MSRKDEWLSEMIFYETIYRSVTKRKTKIIEIPPRERELGYTSSDGTIHIARRHPIMKTLSEKMERVFRMGVFAHEMCHQIFTDFQYLEEVLKRHPWEMEKRIVGLFANLVEDPAIEYQAETEFGGDLLAALRFSITHIYRNSPDINESDDAFSQLCNALIQFGDMGILKGKFTSKEAFEYFKKIAPEFNQAVTTTDPRLRIDYAERWMEITKPLWETDSVKKEREMMDFIKKLMEDNSITNTNGTGMKPKNGTTNSEESDSVKRRKKILKKLDETNSKNGNAEDEPENDKSGEEGSGPSDRNTDSDEKGNGKNDSDASENPADGNKENDTDKDKTASADKSSDDETDSESENADTKTDSEGKDGENGEENKENPESSSQKESGESDNNEQESNDAESDNNSESTDNTNSSPNSSDEEHKANTENTPDEWADPLGEFETEDGGKEIEKTEIKKLDKSVLDHIESTVERTAHGIAERRKKAEINFDVKSRHYGNIVCKNEIVKIDANNRNAYQAEYGRILKKCGKDISLLTSSLRKIFQQDTGETYRALSGRYNVVRASKESTVKIFDRRRAPKQLEDIAVMLLIDESGSMYGQKATIARETAIILAESFATLQIPCYIMGFTTGSRCDALHHHYVSWKNQKEERIALAGISANNSNFDGYSIRNATQILKRRNAEHKLLFIISDGYPACSKYRSMSEGVADTAEAIQEAKKTAMVLGIGIGDCQPEILKHMYKGSFVHAQKVDGLANVLTRNLKTMLKKL